MRRWTGSRPTRRPGRSATGPGNGSSNGIIRCSSGSAWARISSTTRRKEAIPMADGRNDLLGELAADAALERTDFLVQAADQLHRFLDANAARISELGGLTLIDDDPDYLAVAPDRTFRSRSRYLDEDTGQWQSETEII